MNTSSLAPSNSELDDIMSSIRTTVEAESNKPPSGSADLLEQAAAEEAVESADALLSEAAEDGDDDILELTTADMAPAATEAAPAAEVDDILGVPSLSPADEAADEFDKLLAEISAEKQTRAAEVAAVKEALLADIEPLGEEPMAAPATDVENTAEAHREDDTADALSADAMAPAMPMAENAIPTPPSQMAPTTQSMGMQTAADGTMQLTLPAEVLAMALRPMVKDWLAANLPGVVERLVREEIAKLNS